MIILLRLLPFATGVATVILFYIQSKSPATYPWQVIATPVIFLASGYLIGRKQHEILPLLQRMVPSALAICVAGYGLLLAEGIFATIVIPLSIGCIAFVCLELLFFSTYLPARYPVNGLSHVNLALVPLILWLASFTSVGIMDFINASVFIPIAVMTGTTALLFWATSHADASRESQRRWTLIGAFIGMHLGILGALLPLSLTPLASLSALLGALVLRARRYGITPALRRRVMFLEPVIGTLFVAMLLVTSRWV